MQKLDDLLLNLVVVFDACRIKGVTPLWAAEAAKQVVIPVRHRKRDLTNSMVEQTL